MNYLVEQPTTPPDIRPLLRSRPHPVLRRKPLIIAAKEVAEGGVRRI